MSSALPDLTRRADRFRETALKNIEQIRAYADLVDGRLAKGQPVSPVQVQSILRNAEELLAAAAVLDQLSEIQATQAAVMATAAAEVFGTTHEGRPIDARNNIPAGEQS